MPFDVALAGSGLEDEFLQRAVVPTDVGGTRVPIIERSGLVIAKVLAGRTKDLDDARPLWQLHGPEMDADRIRDILQSLEEALAESDLVSTFDALSNSRQA